MRLPLALGLALIALPAAAHEGDHTHMAAAPALQHLLTEPDHLLILGMLAAILALPVVRLVLRRIRR